MGLLLIGNKALILPKAAIFAFGRLSIQRLENMTKSLAGISIFHTYSLCSEFGDGRFLWIYSSVRNPGRNIA